ncbi:tyrosine-protein phosphatase [Robertkochia sediminum]|uniref:tyrosine-protein phosphatase n=1 Tax=Robertkochia sediminum TaxID=2785326 RepID=UPI001934251C|nr:CpsB/CapC family capsule biosynthesis tyrosine phosphatase [Robertkochia sediminum]MBL7473751.1 hypothetical protein [Robertkochia sediminum]
MLSFFSSKILFKELTNNAVDIHCHLLPGLDDGAKDLGTALDMLKNYRQLGYRKVICTPHIMEDYYKVDAEKIATTLTQLRTAAKNANINIILEAAAEHMTDGQFERLLQEKALLPLFNNLVLIETGFLAAPLNLPDLIFEMTNVGYTPVIAHPERYGYLKKPKHFQRLRDQGCLLQVNALSLTGYYGKSIQQKAEMLLENDLVDVIGTDAHHARHLQRLLEFKVSKKMAGQLEVIFERTNQLFG